MNPVCYDEPFWTLYPQYIPLCKSNEMNFTTVYQALAPYVQGYEVRTMRGVYPSKRQSCVFASSAVVSSSSSRLFNYNHIVKYDWNQAPFCFQQIRECIENTIMNSRRFDYCLVHFYENGESYISRHNDKEALNSSVVSLSLGTSRIFRLQRIGISSGWEKEFNLNGGDLLVMKIGCQRHYEHWVPVQKKIHEPRINFTFRFYDS